ncbi:MAG: hypothetical protein NTY20_03845 [Candidatus Aenigmarchaeota archaeon]|nr:hypothetical protein [Candidatus Aenigmarchaeota archaeon]
MDLKESLEECDSFACIFNLVKKSVEDTLNKRRDGLMLALQYLPENLGAYYGLGSNFIVMNKALLEKFRVLYDEKATKSYVFSVLLHEYLHSLGYVDEGLARELCYHISKATLGEEHLSTKIAKHGIAAFIPEHARGLKIREREEIDVVESFDMTSITYIG